MVHVVLTDSEGAYEDAISEYSSDYETVSSDDGAYSEGQPASEANAFRYQAPT